MERLGPLEKRVMDAVWRGDAPVAVRDVMAALNAGRDDPLAYTTVMTTLARLADKGLLRRQRVGRAYVYEPVAEDAAELAVREVVREFGDAALAHFVDEIADDDALRRRLQRLLGDEDG